MKLSRYLVAAAGAGLCAGLAACGNGPPAGGGGPSGASCPGTAGVTVGTAAVKVSAVDAQVFQPTSSTVKVGQVIQWTNTGTIQHNITFDAGCLTDAALNPGSTWQIKFSGAGSYTYHCTIHPGMDGTLTVSS